MIEKEKMSRHVLLQQHCISTWVVLLSRLTQSPRDVLHKLMSYNELPAKRLF